MEDEPLWANIDAIVEAHASGTGAEPPHSYAFTRWITKKVRIRRAQAFFCGENRIGFSGPYPPLSLRVGRAVHYKVLRVASSR